MQVQKIKVKNFRDLTQGIIVYNIQMSYYTSELIILLSSHDNFINSIKLFFQTLSDAMQKIIKRKFILTLF